MCGTAMSQPTTVYNFNGLGVDRTDEITKFDDAGNKIDAMDGGIIQVGSTYYLYGDSYSCGFTVASTSDWCGFNLYTSTDLNVWHKIGSLVDQNDSGWKARCSRSPDNDGCFRPKLAFNAADNQFVLWMWAPVPTTSGGYYVATCATLALNSCVYSNSPTPNVSPGDVGDAGLFVDDNGDGYLIFSNSSGTRCPYVSKLTADYKNFTGSATQVVTSCGIGIEAPNIYRKGSVYYATYGQLCDYCPGTDTSYSTASTPLGTWTTGGVLTADSCNGQNVGTFKLTINSATVYLYIASQPVPSGPLATSRNQSQANSFYHIMTFTGSTPDAVTFDATVTFDLAPTTPPVISPPVDQSDAQSTPGFVNWCNITSSTWVVQPFTPSASGNARVRLPVAPSLDSDGDFIVKLVTLDGSNNPASTLSTQTIPRAGLPLAPTINVIDFGYAVVSGTTYGIVLSTDNTVGCYSYAFAKTLPYTVSARYTINAGSSWSTSANNIMFSTLLPAAPIGGWRR